MFLLAGDKKKAAELEPGDVLGDMHEGRSVLDRLAIVEKYRVTQMTAIPSTFASAFIKATVSMYRDDYVYTNKFIVVIAPVSFLQDSIRIMVGWAYDNHTLGVAHLELIR